MFTGIFVDDKDQDCQDYSSRMSILEPPKLTVEPRKPDKGITDLAEEIIHKKPDLVALDFRLDETPVEGDGPQPNRYKAGPLAQQLRDKTLENFSSDFPIILVSSEDKVETFYKPDLTTHDLFDYIFTKEQLVRDEAVSKNRILSLIEGYKKIIGAFTSNERLFALLEINEEEEPYFNKQFTTLTNQFHAPHQVARSIFNNIISRPGPLLSRSYVLGVLGVDHESENIQELFDILAKNKIIYSGVFSSGWARWWSTRLENFGEQICSNSVGNLTAEERVECLNKALDIRLSPARSTWTGKSDALFGFACASCKQPTEKKHSVSAYDPIALDFLQKKRICWRCVQTGVYQDEGLSIDEKDMFIANKIENGKILPEG